MHGYIYIYIYAHVLCTSFVYVCFFNHGGVMFTRVHHVLTSFLHPKLHRTNREPGTSAGTWRARWISTAAAMRSALPGFRRVSGRKTVVETGVRRGVRRGAATGTGLSTGLSVRRFRCFRSDGRLALLVFWIKLN